MLFRCMLYHFNFPLNMNNFYFYFNCPWKRNAKLNLHTLLETTKKTTTKVITYLIHLIDYSIFILITKSKTSKGNKKFIIFDSEINWMKQLWQVNFWLTNFRISTALKIFRSKDTFEPCKTQWSTIMFQLSMQ